jgi:DNA-binding transcriptional ArsR family regulator
MNHEHSIKLNAAKGSKLLKVMGNKNRLFILFCLKKNEYSVSELEMMLDLSQSALSQHLAILRKDGLVKTKRFSQSIYYYLPDNDANKVLNNILDIFSAPIQLSINKSISANTKLEMKRAALF